MDGIDLIASKSYVCADFDDTQKNKRFEKHSPDAKNKKCAYVACTKLALLGMAGTRTHGGCGKPSSLGVDGRKKAEYLAQNPRLGVSTPPVESVDQKAA